jgi:BirA family biotin operon repressor/biotin-[acetyl-CoA-carboxylase] ligase
VKLVTADGGRRKLAGILTETATAGERVEHVVVGIGVNVNTTRFPPELEGRATSLRLALGREFDRADVLADILAALEPRLEDFDRRGPVAAVEAFASHARLPDRCRVTTPGRPDDVLEGIAMGVDVDGALLLRDDAQRVHRIVSGEIQA